MNKLTLIVCLLLACSRVDAQQDFCSIRNRSFQDGEHLKFKVFYNVGRVYVGAGDADFTISEERLNDKPVYHIDGTGSTNKSYDIFFRVRDHYQSFLDITTLMPVKFLRDVNEGGYKIKNDVTFNQKSGKALSENKSIPIPKCTQDVLSTIYYARNIDYSKLKPGDKIPFSMFLDDKVYPLFIRYMGREVVKTKYGTFNAIKIAPQLIEGTIFKGGEKMIVWVSDDANHLPLRIESPILIGNIKVDLVQMDNLRHPMESLVKK